MFSVFSVKGIETVEIDQEALKTKPGIEMERLQRQHEDKELLFGTLFANKQLELTFEGAVLYDHAADITDEPLRVPRDQLRCLPLIISDFLGKDGIHAMIV